MQGVNLGTVKSRLVRGRAYLKADSDRRRRIGQSQLAPTAGFEIAWERRRDERLQCSAGKFTEYLDGRMNGREMQQIAAHLEDCRGVRPGVGRAASSAGVTGFVLGARAGAGRSAAADSRGGQPGARAQPAQRLPRLEPGLEEHRRSIPAAGLGRVCQRGAAAGHGHCAGHHVCPAGVAAGQPRTSLLAIPLRRGWSASPPAREQPDRRRRRPGGGRGLREQRKARCTTIASSPVRPMQIPAHRLRICC
jgi:hypothetical protein